MNQCSDCGLIDPPDTHTCQQYEDRIRAERAMMTTDTRLRECEARIEALEQRLAQVTTMLMGSKPWGKL